MPIASCVHTTAVQSAAEPLTSVQSSPSYCKVSALDGAEFMKSIQKIVRHGDLNDVTFIEKALRTKFIFGYGLKPDGSVDRQSLIYKTKDVLDSPIQANLYVNYNKIEKSKYDLIARLSLDNRYFPSPYVSYIQDCLSIPTSDVYSSYGQIGFGIASDGSSEAGGTQQLGDPGKNGTMIYLNIGYDINTKIIDHVSIIERP